MRDRDDRHVGKGLRRCEGGGLTRLAVLAALLLPAACAPDPAPQDNFYRLDVPAAAAQSGSPALTGVLEVERFSADGLSGGRPIVYSRATSPLQLNEYHYHLWTDSPAVMLQDRFVTFARASALADTVVTPEMRVEPDYVMRGRILRFEQVVGPEPQAVVGLEFGLRAVDSGRILLLKTYERREPADDGSVPAAVRAFDRALAGIMQTLAADLRGG